MIYVIRPGEDPAVKIGFSDNVKSRLIALQTGQAKKLHLLRVIEGSRATERWLHHHYAALWVEREWFIFDPSMLSIMPPEEVRNTSDSPSAFDALLAAFGGRNTISEITGARYNAITQWRLSGVPFRYWIPLLDAAAERNIAGVDRDLLKATRVVLEAA
jgi:hypothetical protein